MTLERYARYLYLYRSHLAVNHGDCVKVWQCPDDDMFIIDEQYHNPICTECNEVVAVDGITTDEIDAVTMGICERHNSMGDVVWPPQWTHEFREDGLYCIVPGYEGKEPIERKTKPRRVDGEDPSPPPPDVHLNIMVRGDVTGGEWARLDELTDQQRGLIMPRPRPSAPSYNIDDIERDREAIQRGELLYDGTVVNPVPSIRRVEYTDGKFRFWLSDGRVVTTLVPEAGNGEEA